MRSLASLLYTGGRSGTLRYVALLVLVSALCRSPTLVSHNFNVDEAIYTSLATEMLDGALYYRDVVDHKPPGIYYVYAAVYAAFGRYNLVAIHLALFVTVALTGLLLAPLGRRLFGGEEGHRAGRLAGLLYVVVGATGPPMDFQAANAELFMNLPTVAALLLYLRTRQTGGTWGYLWAGLVLSAGALIKFQAGFVAVAIAVHLLVSGPPRLLPLALGFLGIVLPFAGHAALYAGLGAWGEMMWGITFNTRYVTSSSLGFQLLRALARTAIFVGLSLPLLVPALVYALRGRGERSSPQRQAWAFLLAWLLSAAAAVSVGGRYFLHYYIQLVPVLALMGSRRLLLWTERKRVVGVVVGVLLALNVGSWIVVSYFDRPLRPAEAWHHDRYAAVGRYVREHTAPDARIFVWGDSANIYLYARRQMGTRYLWVNYQTGHIWGTPYDAVGGPPPPPELIAQETWPLLLGDLERNRPELVIDAGAGKLDEFDEHPLTQFPAVAAIVGRHYKLETTVMGVPIYRRR